jgi:hydrogenase maturation protein HypF
MNTYHIHIKGIVQGVGFRPFVFNLARKENICGWVNNTLDGVHVEFNAQEEQAQRFYRQLISSAPRIASISSHRIKQVSGHTYDDFQIVDSGGPGELDMPITPDFALCDDCRLELHDPANRRFNYPFTTCTNCGPRYSIIQSLPYDRPVTTMNGFTMCPDCRQEYDDPADRRYYSQTNSCPTCGIELSLFDRQKKPLAAKEPIREICERLLAGQILAVKGIGGYLLVCDANNKLAIEELRARKHRPAKPFAVMYPDLETMQRDVEINDLEQQELLSEVAPILLLKKNRKSPLSIQDGVIAPGLSRLGCMLPYAPLFELILQQLAKPVIATSGNISGSPIIFDDQLAIDELTSIADVVVGNNRPITLPQDDSVISFSNWHHKKIIHRRARGLAPNYFNPKLSVPDISMLALGAEMKSSFTLVNNRKVYISQYLGDMENFLTQEAFEHSLNHLLALFNKPPEAILIDKHPNYFTTQLGSRLAGLLTSKLLSVQHHKAHFAAVLGENELIDTSTPVMGVIWDGTGYGDDQQIWGGEFFLYKDHTMERIAHLNPFPAILGDKMAREPRISALAAGFGLQDINVLLMPKFSRVEWQTYNHLLTREATALTTTSMGRLFDAAASLVLGIDKISYEGEAAIQLEQQAKQYFLTHEVDLSLSYFSQYEKIPQSLNQNLLQSVVNALKNKKTPDEIAARFHVSLVDLVRHTARAANTKKIAFSGGVLQNELLNDLLISLLGNEYKLYFHQQLSPNDENISFGQIVYHFINLPKKR